MRLVITSVIASILLFVAVGALGAAAQTPGTPAPTPTPAWHDPDATHKQVPAMPIVVDGVRYEPTDFARKFEGIPVYMVGDPDTLKSEGVVYAFTSQDAFRSYMKQRFSVNMDRPAAPPQRGPASAPE